MTLFQPPPIAKVYEALGAIADGRISCPTPASAKVPSSSGDKVYAVDWAEDFSWMSSDDNASRWQGYMGYPLIMVLLSKKPLPYDAKVAEALREIPWKKLNAAHKNDYSKTIEDVLKAASEKGYNPKIIKAECERILAILNTLTIEKRFVRKNPATKAQPTQGELF